MMIDTYESILLVVTTKEGKGGSIVWQIFQNIL